MLIFASDIWMHFRTKLLLVEIDSCSKWARDQDMWHHFEETFLNVNVCGTETIVNINKLSISRHGVHDVAYNIHISGTYNDNGYLLGPDITHIIYFWSIGGVVKAKPIQHSVSGYVCSHNQCCNVCQRNLVLNCDAFKSGCMLYAVTDADTIPYTLYQPLTSSY